MQQPLKLTASPSRRWQCSSRLWFVILMLGVITVFWSTLITLHQRWTQWDGSYAHGYIMVALCLAVVFTRLPPQWVMPRWRLLVILLALSVGVLWSIGFATQVGAVSQLAVYGALLVVVVSIAGWSGAWSAAFPLALLTLSLPVWEVLISPLQALTTWVATWFIRLLDVPAFIQGNSFTLPSGTVVIAGGCAGLNYFMIGLALSGLNALYRQMSWRQGVVSIGLLVALAVVGNWGRVIALILIAYQSQMQSSLVYDHGMFGWWIFAALFAAYLWLVSGFHGSEKRSVPSRFSLVTKSLKTYVLFGAVLAMGLWALPLFVQVQTGPSTSIRSVESDILQPIDPVRGAALFRHRYEGTDKAEYYEALVASSRWTVARLIYLNQSQGKELISHSNQVTEYSYQRLPSAILSENSLQAIQVNARQPELHLWQYQIGSAVTTDPIQGKLMQLTALLNGESVVALWHARIVCSDAGCRAELANVENNIESIRAALISPLQLY
ncbi:exosortase [Reinekea blandensis]|uniref:Methanolan biosynthesis EpsI domain-containing protein n=1 Tax=Reinekea blandensis MED297 TaxID=314283 RepID=A4B951_9GAMM|nr:exosortase [Reinekea blandensis]EAR11152.1 hypothetical protein MED297_19732 [Reinekea sp. MED297] [Reinekea blandensis MED297]